LNRYTPVREISKIHVRHNWKRSQTSVITH
jgi:hypothetical protein